MFRAHGVATVSIADIMSEVGLTVGGFYRHFESKEVLVSEAIGEASLQATAAMERVAARADGKSCFRELVAFYLAQPHRQHPERGCPLPSLALDSARGSPANKQEFRKAVLAVVAQVQKARRDHDRTASLHAVAALVGAMVLSRAIDGDALADEIVDAVKNSLSS